jgi:outer membrane murein-binding lipoprotein Lpp
MEFQARICPTCIDDHSEDRECHIEDLKARIATLSAKVKRLQCLLLDVNAMAEEITNLTAKRMDNR